MEWEDISEAGADHGPAIQSSPQVRIRFRNEAACEQYQRVSTDGEPPALFAARTYVVMPATIKEEDRIRLESLCLLFGVGLVLFNPSKTEPEFDIRVRAQRFWPDMFYVNLFARQLHKTDEDKFQKLFP
jgi:hypothetical protein